MRELTGPWRGVIGAYAALVGFAHFWLGGAGLMELVARSVFDAAAASSTTPPRIEPPEVVSANSPYEVPNIRKWPVPRSTAASCRPGRRPIFRW